MSSQAKHMNAELNLSGKNVAVSGGTQGIGAATAVRFAQAGAESIYVIGRNSKKGNKVIEELKRAGGGGEGKNYEFIQADLSLVSNVKKVVEQLKQKTGDKGVHYLITTQGGPPNGKFSLTSEGHEFRFAVQHISRFGLAYLLAQSGTLKEAWITVCAPSGTNGSAPNLDDLELKQEPNLGWVRRFMAQAKQDGAVEDGLVSNFPRVFPHLRAIHLFPGYVHTQAAANQGFPYPLTLAQSIFGPLLTYLPIGNTPASFSEIPVYLAANPLARKDAFSKGSRFVNQSLKEVGEPRWCDEEEGGKTRDKLWEMMKGMYE